MRVACALCANPAPDDWPRPDPWCCSLACYYSYGGIEAPAPPSRHDGVTTPCPVCGRTFTPVGRQAYCCGACRAVAYRRRRDAGAPAVVVPKTRPRRPITVYECDGCGERALGDQRCENCNTWMRRVGVGGCCPACDEPIALNELLDSNN